MHRRKGAAITCAAAILQSHLRLRSIDIQKLQNEFCPSGCPRSPRLQWSSRPRSAFCIDQILQNDAPLIIQQSTSIQLLQMRTSPNATLSAQPWVRRQRLQVNLEKRNKTQTEKRVASSRVKKHLALGELCALDIGATLPPPKKRNPRAWPSACSMTHRSFSATACYCDVARRKQCYHIWSTPPQRTAFMAKEHWCAPYSLLRPSSSRSENAAN